MKRFFFRTQESLDRRQSPDSSFTKRWIVRRLQSFMWLYLGLEHLASGLNTPFFTD
jgi:hypothetical protein